MKRILILCVCLAASAVIYSQSLDTPDPEQIGVSSAQQKLKEVSVDKFENEGTWLATMSSDEGFVKARLLDGSPKEKQPIPDEEGLDIPDTRVLGVRVDFLRRGYNTFTVYPAKPLPVAGITKTVSVWVAGRSFNHTLMLLLEDYRGTPFELYMGKLNFTGWKKLTASIPPQAADGKHGIIQRDYHYTNLMGLKIRGFKIVCDPEDAYGNYYIYFDDLRAYTDLYAEEGRDEDDMMDNW